MSGACAHCRHHHIRCQEIKPCFCCIKKGIADECKSIPNKKYSRIRNDINYTNFIYVMNHNELSPIRNHDNIQIA